MSPPPPVAVREILLPADTIQTRVSALAAEISADYRDGAPFVLVGVLKGAFIFLADLARQLTVPHEIEFIALSSYDLGAASGEVRLELDVRHRLDGKAVLIVEDIIDSGRTLRYLIRLFEAHGTDSVRTCALLRRKSLAAGPPIDYVGFDIPDEPWVVGYGLDYAEQHRTLPYVGVVDVRP